LLFFDDFEYWLRVHVFWSQVLACDIGAGKPAKIKLEKRRRGRSLLNLLAKL
jgi:hypothetical protein